MRGQNSSVLYVAFATGIIAIGVFGVFGSPLDSSRVSWLFYFYLFVSLLRPKDDVSKFAEPQSDVGFKSDIDNPAVNQ